MTKSSGGRKSSTSCVQFWNQRGISPGDSNTEEAIPDEDFPDITASLDLVTVASYSNYTDAATDRLALEANGLKVWILNEHVPELSANLYQPGVYLPGIQIQVRKEDMPAAIRILESEPVPSSDLPDEIAEPPCPKVRFPASD